MSRGGKIAIGVAIALAVLVPLAVLLAFKPYRLPSESMEPTYGVGNRVVAGRNGFPFGEAGRGDVVIVTPPAGALDASTSECGVEPQPGQACPRPTPGKADVKFIQRIVAVGGERLSIRGGRAYVNDRPLDEPYARLDDACEVCTLETPITVPEGHVFVMGDNRGNSADSRVWGPVPEDWIVAKVLFKYWG